jgi:hypothetical protein
MQAIDEQIERLRVRLRNGDPDLAPDELQYFGGQIKLIPHEDGSLYAEYLETA